MIGPTTVHTNILGPRQAYAWSSLSTFIRIWCFKDEPLSANALPKQNAASLSICGACPWHKHAWLPHGHSALQAGEQGSKSNIAFKVKGTNLDRPNKDTGRVTGHSYNHETTIKIISGDFCSVAKQPGLHTGQHLRWLRLLKEAGRSEVMLALLRQPQNRMN